VGCVGGGGGGGGGGVAKTCTQPLTNSICHNELTASIFVVGSAR